MKIIFALLNRLLIAFSGETKDGYFSEPSNNERLVGRILSGVVGTGVFVWSQVFTIAGFVFFLAGQVAAQKIMSSIAAFEFWEIVRDVGTGPAVFVALAISACEVVGRANRFDRFWMMMWRLCVAVGTLLTFFGFFSGTGRPVLDTRDAGTFAYSITYALVWFIGVAVISFLMEVIPERMIMYAAFGQDATADASNGKKKKVDDGIPRADPAQLSCPRCKNKVVAGQNKCGNCGAILRNTEAGFANATAPQN